MNSPNDSIPDNWIKERAADWTPERPSYVMRPPSVGELLSEAEQEPNFIDLAEYWPVVQSLREKGFSYREVANWLTARGIEVSYGAVYRLCTRRLSYKEQELAQMEMEEEEQEEMHRHS